MNEGPAYRRLKRSFPPIAAPDARLLILGSLPGERSLAQKRYYAHPQNQFWRLMSEVLGTDLTALGYEARLTMLVTRRVALWDVVASARRVGSTDAAITDATANDVAALVAGLPGLRAVAFNGGAAFRSGGPLLEKAGTALIPLPSSSPLHTIGLEAKLPAWLALRRHLGDAPAIAESLPVRETTPIGG